MGEFSASLALFGPTKSICAGENLFAWDSGLLRLSPIRFVRQVEGECSAMWNVRKLQVQMRAIVWRCSPEFLPSSSQPHHVAAATAMKNSVGDSRISARVGRCARPTGTGENSHVESVPDHLDFFSAGEEFGADALSYRNASVLRCGG